MTGHAPFDGELPELLQKRPGGGGHCFNTLRRAYPEFGGHYESVHHTRLIAQLLRKGRLKL